MTLGGVRGGGAGKLEAAAAAEKIDYSCAQNYCLAGEGDNIRAEAVVIKKLSELSYRRG